MMNDPANNPRFEGVDRNETFRRLICEKKIYATYLLAALIALIGIITYAISNPNPAIKIAARDAYISFWEERGISMDELKEELEGQETYDSYDDMMRDILSPISESIQHPAGMGSVGTPDTQNSSPYGSSPYGNSPYRPKDNNIIR